MRWTFRIGAAALLSLLVVPSLFGQTENLTGLPGYFDLDELGLFEPEEASLEISIQEPLIGLVASGLESAESELAALLRALKSIRLRTYPVPEGESGRVGDRVSEIARSLDRRGWQRIVTVRDENENIYIYLRQVEESVAGMVVLAFERGESLTMVNVVGRFEPEQLEQLGRSLSIESLEELGRRTEEERE